MSGSIYGMQGLGTNGLGVNASGAVPQMSPMSALMGGAGGQQGLGPMSQYMQQNPAMVGQQHPMMGQSAPQQPFVPGQQQGAAGGQSPMAALLAQLQGGQQGLSPQAPTGQGQAPQLAAGQAGLFGTAPQGGMQGVLANLLRGYNANGNGIFTGQPSPANTAGGGGVA